MNARPFPPRTRSYVVTLLLSLAVLGAPACTRVDDAPPAQPPPQKLEPVPEPPAIQVEQEDVPGANGELAVVAARPTGEVGGVVRPIITFSKPIVALETVSSQQQRPPPASIEPPIPGEWRWVGSASVEFVPTGLIPYATPFTVTVPAGLTALDGKKLEKPYTYTFNTPSPSIQDVTPSTSTESTHRWATPDQTFTLLLNQPVVNLASFARIEFPPPRKPVAVQVLKEVDVAQELRDSEEGRTYERQSFEDRGFKNRQTRYELKAATPLPLDQPFTLVVKGELKAKEGPLTLGKPARYPYKTYGPMEWTEARACFYSHPEWECNDGVCRCPYGPLVIRASNHVDVASLKGKLKIDPKVEIDWEHVESSKEYTFDVPYVAVPGRFKPGVAYSVTIDAGAKDEFGQAAPAFRGSFKTSDIEPYLNIGSTMALLEAAGDGAIPLETANLSSVTAYVWTVKPGELAQLLGAESGEPIPTRQPATLEVNVTGTKNRTRWTPLELRKALPSGQKTGLFVAAVGANELILAKKAKPERLVAQITDLAVHAKLGAKSGVAWVTSLASGKPVEGAKVSLYDAAGAKKWDGTSGADGTVAIPGLSSLVKAKYEWSTPFALLAAEKGSDIGVTLSTWEAGYWPGTFGVQSDGLSDSATSLGTVFTDRGIYRPGDEVFVKGMVRYRRLGDIKAPPTGVQAHVKITDSKDTTVLEEDVPLTKFGTFNTKLALKRDMPLGTCWISVSTKAEGQELHYGGDFRVEEYRAPQFQVDVTVPESQLATGDPVKASVLARYLFGAGMAGAKVRWSIGRETSSYLPPGNDAFTFGIETWWWDDEEPEPSSDTFASGEGAVDDVGNFLIEAGKAETPGDKTWEYTIEAEVEDVNRQRVANRQKVLVHPAAVYAGLRVAADGFARAGKPTKLELIAVDPRGKRLSGVDVAVEVRRREWQNIRKKGVGDRWYTVTEPVETKVSECKVKSEANAVACEFTPPQAGMYVLEARATDAQGRRQVTRTATYAIGDGWVSWQRNDTDKLDLVADKALYDIGETAKVLVKSPYPTATALVTVEREGIMSRKLMELKGAATALEIPLDESHIPNAFVSVVLVRGRVGEKEGIETGDDPGRPSVRVGYVELKVEKKSKRLNVSVTPNGEEKKPRDKVSLDLKVTDWKGQGAKAELTVWAVDEGVLRLTGYQLPDLVEAIHPPRGLAVRVAEPLMHLVLRRLYGEKGAIPGGGGGLEAGGGIRSNFKTTAVWEPSVVTDDQGNAKVEFTLPDNLTTFRIMVVAATDGDRFGGGQSKVVVSKPLMALPALPRLARVGDRIEAGVVVHARGAASDGSKIKKAKVTAKVEGITLAGAATKTVSLEDGRAHEVRFNFVADKEGAAKFVFTVEGGNERDGVEQTLPIILPVTMEAVAAYGDTRDKRVEGIVPPGGVRPGIGGLELTLASTVLAGYQETMRQLVDYPYGCLEQLTSRLIPFIALREIYSRFGLDMPMPGEKEEQTHARRQSLLAAWFGVEALKLAGSTNPDEVIVKTVRAIERLQNSDGGFRYWPGEGCSSQFGSAYAVMALHRAKELGYPVGDAYATGQKFLAEQVAAGKPVSCVWGSYPPDDATRTFALYVLARTGAPKSSYYGELYKRRDKLPLFAKAMLADAMFVGGGDRQQARNLIGELMQFAQESPSGVHFQEKDPRTWATLWSSDTRTTAIMLQTLTTVSPEHPFVGKIGRWLTDVRGKDGRYRNTQEAAFTLMALTEVLRTKEKAEPNYVAKVTMGSEVLATGEFRGRNLNAQKSQVSIDRLQSIAKPGTQVPLTFSKEGEGVLYYGALLRYAPQEMPTTPLDRGLVVQRWLEPWKGGGQARQFSAGDLVRVRVRVGSPMERHYVAVDVALPAGLEPVDTSLASTAQQTGASESSENYEYESDEESYGEGEVADDFGPWASYFYSPFNFVEKRDDRVVLFADILPPGVHVATFTARATTPGDYLLKPAHAEEMYTPEVFGRSDGGRVQVYLGPSVAAK